MKKRERNNTDAATGMTLTLCVLFFAILLRDYSTGNFGWHWTILMIAVIVSLFVGNALVTLLQKARQSNSSDKRERTNRLVVGIERNDQRALSPDSTIVFDVVK